VSNAPGKFVVVEGTEGVGKSTAMHHIEALLQQHGIDVQLTREPGGTPLAEEIRNALLRPRDEVVEPMAELLLMFAARAQHVAGLIRPTLARGSWVLSDRFVDSSFAYQGGGRGLMLPVNALTDLVLDGFAPDLTLVLDVPVSVGLKRARGDMQGDRIEREETDFFERARNTFLERAAQMPHRYAVIDAIGSLPVVRQRITEAMETLLND
jgi:dTMP kinase